MNEDLDERLFMAGAITDTRVLLGMIAEASALCERNWSMSTFCHRVIGDPEIVTRLRQGRVHVRRYPTIKRDLENYIKDRTDGNGSNGRGGSRVDNGAVGAIHRARDA